MSCEHKHEDQRKNYKCKYGHTHYYKKELDNSSKHTYCREHVNHLINFHTHGNFIEENKQIPYNPSYNPICKSFVRIADQEIGPPDKVSMKAHATIDPLSFQGLQGVYSYTTYPEVKSKRVTIAIIDAYLYRTSDGSSNIGKSNAPNDFVAFAARNGFKAPTMMSPIKLSNKVNPINFTGISGGNGPYFVEAALSTCGLDPDDNTFDPGWPLEQALDYQAIYGMTNTTKADGPNIILVHANSSSFTDLTNAINASIDMGAHIVSCSWGTPEYPGETSMDVVFNNVKANKVCFVVSTGDDSYGSYPAFSPYVIAVGGTSLSLNGNTRIAEEAWGFAGYGGSGGGGVSGDSSGGTAYTSGLRPAMAVQERVPLYQKGLAYKGRSIPDLSSYASSKPGVEIVLSQYVAPQSTTSYLPQYYNVGGTSLSAPCIAALLAICNQNRLNIGKPVLNSVQVLTALYDLYNRNTSKSYCSDYIYNVSKGITYLNTAKSSVINGRVVTSWSYQPDNSAVPVLSSKGYDLATGLGVPSSGLIGYLSGL